MWKNSRWKFMLLRDCMLLRDFWVVFLWLLLSGMMLLFLINQLFFILLLWHDRWSLCGNFPWNIDFINFMLNIQRGFFDIYRKLSWINLRFFNILVQRSGFCGNLRVIWSLWNWIHWITVLVKIVGDQGIFAWIMLISFWMIRVMYLVGIVMSHLVFFVKVPIESFSLERGQILFFHELREVSIFDAHAIFENPGIFFDVIDHITSSWIRPSIHHVFCCLTSMIFCYFLFVERNIKLARTVVLRGMLTIKAICMVLIPLVIIVVWKLLMWSITIELFAVVLLFRIRLILVSMWWGGFFVVMPFMRRVLLKIVTIVLAVF